jgi:hypothetical protein
LECYQKLYFTCVVCSGVFAVVHRRDSEEGSCCVSCFSERNKIKIASLKLPTKEDVELLDFNTNNIPLLLNKKEDEEFRISFNREDNALELIVDSSLEGVVPNINIYLYGLIDRPNMDIQIKYHPRFEDDLDLFSNMEDIIKTYFPLASVLFERSPSINDNILEIGICLKYRIRETGSVIGMLKKLSSLKYPMPIASRPNKVSGLFNKLMEIFGIKEEEECVV